MTQSAEPGLTFDYAPAPESRSIVDIAPSYGLFIDGEFVDGTGEPFKSVNPATEEVLAEVSTGKVNPAATLPVGLVMLEAVRDFRIVTGRQVGFKPAGGIRTTKDAIKHLVLINETVGADWLDPDRFRFGASSLLNDLLLQRQKLRTGHYSGPDYVTVD